MELTELVKLLIPVIILQVLLMIFALISCVKAERTRGPKLLWILIIVFVQFIGPVLYFVLGKEEA